MSERRTIWGLRFFSLLVAIMAWAVISFGQRERFTEQRLEVPLQWVGTPSDLIMLEAPDNVEVVLSGPESRMETVNRFLITLQVDLGDAVKGPQTVRLTPEAVNRPQGIEVVAIEPSTISIELDELVTEVRPVRAVLSGEPAAGAVVTGTRVSPSTVAVRGPESILSAIQELTTEPLSLDGHAIDFEERKLIEDPGSRVTPLQLVVTVQITLEVPSAASALQESPAL